MVKLLVSEWHKEVGGRSHKAQNMTKRRGQSQGVKSKIKARASRWHLQGMELLPMSPPDSSPLGRGKERGEGAVSFRKVIRNKEQSREARVVL